jgi:hypothetical protein
MLMGFSVMLLPVDSKLEELSIINLLELNCFTNLGVREGAD